MKVDTSKLKKGSSELTPECRQLIEQITKCKNRTEILKFLETIQVWVYGKCELYHWIEILDRFDKVLEEAAHHVNGNEFVLHCDTTFSPEDIRLLLLVLNFTTLLIEHSFSRHLYNSIEHLTQLLSSQNMDIVLAVLNLLYMFSKRSNFIPRLAFDKKEMLLIKLFNIAERWGDPNYGLALIDCCMRKPKFEFLYQLFVEYLDECGQGAVLEIPDMMDICENSTPSEVVNAICKQMSQPSDKVKMRIAHRVRLVSGFKDHKLRLQFVQARLQAVSVLIYSNALQDNIERVLYPGFGEELCELIEKEDVQLVEIRAAVLRTLTSMLHFDRNPNVPRPGSRLPKIIQYTGADRQGGILPLLVRDCISSLIGEGPSDKYPLILATSLFSLLYHLASYEAGANALVKSGMMQSLLQVISWPGVDLEHITFVTRAVRVIDLITNIDIAKFHQNNGLNVFIDRLEKEISSCRKAMSDTDTTPRGIDSAEGHADESFYQHDQIPHEGRDHLDEPGANDEVLSEGSENHNIRNESPDGDTRFLEGGGDRNVVNMEAYEGANVNVDNISQNPRYPSNSYYARPLNERTAQYSTLDNQQQKKVACVTQRAALLKSMLNFLKKSIQDHAHFNGMRNIMETSLPSSLRHIISNAEYYGPSLFLLATDVFTVYVFNEPSLLSSLQDSGITSVMLQSLLQKDVPATREVLGSLPNVFSAMCLNERGLMEFMSYEPFDKLLRVLLSPDYLVAMRRRRSSDPLGDTATNLGNAMDDLMKHHPYLRTDATEAIVRLLHELVRLGTDPNFICWRANKDNNTAGNSGNTTNNAGNNGTISANTVSDNGSNENENDSSGDDEDEDDEMSSASQQQRQNRSVSGGERQPIQTRIYMQEREAIPLIDYILNVMKFIEAIFTNSSNGEHCREFVLLGGLKPLLQLLSLPNLPVDSPVSTTSQAVANVCKSILNLAHETKVIDTALQQLSQIVEKLQPMIKHFNFSSGSVLLCELLNCPKIEDGFNIADYTPLLHSMSSVHGYVVMLVNLCRNASNEMRTILLKRWGTNGETGLQLLNNLVKLYISLVWESTILLSLCSDEPFAQNANLAAAADPSSTLTASNLEAKSEMDTETGRKPERTAVLKEKLRTDEQLRFTKSLLAASSRLGRALAELFGTLVKLSVGTPQSRQRRNNEFVATIQNSKYPTSDAKEIARVLSSILVIGFNHENILPKPVPKLKLTFLICSVGFTGPMLFDDKRNSFHLMISQFCDENGLNAFFDMFYWVLSLDNTSAAAAKFCFKYCMSTENILEDSDDDSRDFPEGTGEFLDAWLQLLEKMINPRAILESPYAIAQRVNNLSMADGGINFEPVFYLVQMHKLALQTIRRIWKRKPINNYGVSMTETMITILKHLIKSQSNLCDRYKARMNEIQNVNKLLEQSKRMRNASDDAIVNADNLKMLTDMGFMRAHVIEALKNTHSLEQATDYLLNHPEANTWAAQPRSTASTHDLGSATVAPPLNNEMDVDVVMLEPNSTDELPSVSNSNSNSSVNKFDYSEIKPIPEKIFAKFCDEALDQIFSLMEYLPETVNTGAELIYVLFRRLNQTDKYLFIWNLVKSGTDCVEEVLEKLKQKDIVHGNNLDEFMASVTVRQLLIRLKVATLLLDETYPHIRREFCVAISQEPHLGSLIDLLRLTESLLQDHLLVGGRPITPKWLQNLIELIDAIDNVSLISQRKSNMRAVCSDTWKWYDASSGKWNAYSEANNSILKSCFNAGERSIGINIGRQRYTINFNCMTQVSEASGSHRPVMPALKLTDAITQWVTSNVNAKYHTVLTRICKEKNEESGDVYEDQAISLAAILNYSDANDEQSAAAAGEDNKTAASASTTDATTPKEETATTTTSASSTAPATGTATALPPAATTATQADDLSKSSSVGKKTKTSSKGASPKISAAKKTAPAGAGEDDDAKQLKIILHDDPVGLAKFDNVDIITCLVSLLQWTYELNFETKLSILKLCARLTKNYDNAKVFAKCGGISCLLNMRQSCGLMGFPTYAVILIRHVLEAPAVLQDSIERVLAGRTTHLIPAGQRDLTYILTQISSAVARHPAIFLSAAKQIFKCDTANAASVTLDESRFIVKSQTPANRKCTNVSLKCDEDIQTSIDVIKELLHAIVQPCVHYQGANGEKFRAFEMHQEEKEVLMPEIVSPTKSTGSTTSASTTSTTTLTNTPGTTSAAAAAANAKKSTEQIEPSCCSWHIPSSGHMHEKPILPRSTLIKILADAVRSYQSLVPKIIVEHVYTPKDSKLIEKDQTALSFVLDNFLPIVRRNQDPEVSMMSRVLIASMSDCSSHPTLQSKVVEEVHDALVRALSLPESSEKHTRLQVIIGLLPIMIENPLASTKGSLTRNNMYKVLLRQGIMTDLTKIAQYKDLSDSNALATIYSILRPMEILLRLTVAPGALSSRRIILGRVPQGTSTVTRGRYYPRLTTRNNPSGSSNAIDGEYVLRDIIRNVLSDRRHAFDFIFNTDDIFVDHDDPTANADARATDDDPNDGSDDHSASTPMPERSQLNFDRIWDDLLQNENLLLVNRNGGASNNDNLNAGPIGGELHRNHNNDNDTSNTDDGVRGGSDGASTSSETVAAVSNNAQSLLGEVTSSESDSDSNVSTENDDRNEEDEDDDEEDGGEEGVDERSETDADEETRQYIEVFDHIYEPESSETASNDADVDADDEASEVGAASSVIDVPNAMRGAESNSADGDMQIEDQPQRSVNATNREETSEQPGPSGMGAVHNMQVAAGNMSDSGRINSLRTTPASAWVTPRVSFSEHNEVTFRHSVDLAIGQMATAEATVAAAAAVAPHHHNDRNENATVVINVSANNQQQMNNNGQRREPTRRLVFLDQQYCSPMPSYNHPTEEGQIELFNQDSLHWWLEEAKHLDLESQTDACLYVAHFLTPILLEELKVTYKQYAKKTDLVNSTNGAAPAPPAGPGGSVNRRSAIPILIPPNIHAGGPTQPGNNVPSTTTTTITRPSEFLPDGVQFRVPPLRRAREFVAQLTAQEGANAAVDAAVSGIVDGDNHISLSSYALPAIADAIDDIVDEEDDDEEDDDDDDYGDDDEHGDGDGDADGDGADGDDIDDEDDIDYADVDVEPNTEGHEEVPDFNPTFIDEVELPSSVNFTMASSEEATQNRAPEPMTEATPNNHTYSLIQVVNEEHGELQPAQPSQAANADSAVSTVAPSVRNARPIPALLPLHNTAVEAQSAPIEGRAAGATANAETAQVETAEAAAAVAPPPANIPEMSPEVRAALGDLEVPEGVDPSFLAALPSEMREEVIQEHLRMQRVRQRAAQQNAIQTAHDSLLEVNPEFLAALPPNIQSEVLMQQRIEQQRQAAQSTNPEDPVDTAAFFQNLSDSLRQAILTDMEESQIASLPPDLAAEAQYLRRDWESRNGLRVDPSQPNTLSGYLTTRFPSTFQHLHDESRWHTNSIWYDANGAPQSQHHHHTTIVHQNPSQMHGKPAALLVMEDENNLLDPDSLSTLLLFLFIDDTKLNYTRLHRVIRNLCYHSATRDWVIKALISIIHKTNEGKVNFSSEKAIKPEWLKLRVDAAFGYKSNVFIINKMKDSSEFSITINPQAAQMIVRNCLDMLFILAKHFPGSFVPFNRENKNPGKPVEAGPSNPIFPNSIDNIPMALTIASMPGRNSDISTEELRSMFHRHHPAVGNIIARRSNLSNLHAPRLMETRSASDHKLDESPSTSKAAAVRNQQKPGANATPKISKLPKGLQYNTNSGNFWETLLQIDSHTQKRSAHMQSFPLVSQPFWEWEAQNPEFLAFNESPFAKILEMLPYKVICRSPHLTDMLIKLLASLSTELPREEDPIAETADDATKTNEPPKTATATATPTTTTAATNTTTTTGAGAATNATEPSSAENPTKKDAASAAAAPPNTTPEIALKNKRKIYSKNFLQLQLVIEVLTHQCGTSDGLDNISKLIVNLSQCSQASNAIFIQYLTVAILGLAQEVRQAIQCLLDEIRAYNAANKANLEKQALLSAKPSTSTGVSSAPMLKQQGVMQDRFTAENVVISAPNIKPICELQLPAMKKLLSPSSAQPYFLRTLKIFMEVRDLFELQETNGDAAAAANAVNNRPTLSQIICLDHLWNTLSECLGALEESKDENAVLVLQSTVEAFFLIHASQKKSTKKPPANAAAAAAAAAAPPAGGEESSANNGTAGESSEAASRTTAQSDSGQSTEPAPTARETQLKCDRQKFLEFAEKHRTVLNQILRQSPTHLSDGPFAVLVDHTRILDFDVKRKYFQTELERIDEGVRREENTVTVRRVTVFEDSFRVLYRLGPEEWKNRFYIVFEDEEGQDAGGLLREWYVIISREIFNPMYALFCVSPGDRVTYMINPSSHANPNHLSYFKFVGRVIAKAVHDNKLLECYFTRSFYKHILGKQVKHTDMESQDYEFYKGLDYLMKNDISTLGYELTFSTEVQEFGVTQVRDLIPNGRDITVTEENKFEYVQMVCQLKMSGSIRQQLDAFLEGFYDIIPKHLISIFNEQELELLISGLPDIDIEDLKANTEYHKYTSKSIQIQWFWRALRSFDQADRAKFLQFVTGTSKVPLQGFGSLEGMNGIQKFQIHRDDRSTDRLPCAHTCFNQLDLPMYKSYEKLRTCLLKAIHECSEGFGFA